MLQVWNYLRVRYLGEKGQGFIEYAILVAAVVTIVVALTATNGSLREAFTSAVTKITTAMGGNTSTNP